MAEQGSEEVSISTPLGSLSTKGKRMAEIITVILLCITFLLTYILWEHKNDSKEATKEIATALDKMVAAQAIAQREIVASQREMVAAQREQTCLSLVPESRRMEEFTSQWSRCKQLSRER